jgi:hypothetical protein
MFFSYFFKLSASVFDVSPIIGAIVVAVSVVVGGVILFVVSPEFVEPPLPSAQDVKIVVTMAIKKILFI